MTIDQIEEWLPVKNYEGYYEVSNCGRARRVAFRVKGKLKRGRLLDGTFDQDGYIKIHLSKDGISKKRFLHNLIAEAFIGPCPIGKECHHKDENKTNNYLGNLRYLNISKHSQLHNVKKLTDDQVIEIRRLAMEGLPQQEIADYFCIKQSMVSRIITGKRRRIAND